MNRRFATFTAGLAAAALTAGLAATPAQAAPKTSFKLAWSIYVGWMPWGWASDQGIVKKHAEKNGIKIEVVQFNDYVESINQYTAGAFDGVTVTNMDALAIPAAGGVDTTALLVGDFSNGNDAIILKDKKALADIKGSKVNLVELSVSHYLLARGLQSIGLTERDIGVVNTSDADMVGAYKTKDVTAVVTWNPLVAEIAAVPGANKVFDSSKIPGEIIDLTVVNTDVLNDNPALAKALAGAWYETMAIMSGSDEAAKAARAAMGKASGTDLAGFDGQLASTKMFYKAADAAAFAKSPDVKKTMEAVRQFLFAHDLLGKGAKSADVVGITFPDGTVMGDAKNVKFRFDAAAMETAGK